MPLWIFFFLNGSELKRVRSWKDFEHCEIMMVPENPERLLKKGSVYIFGFPCGRMRKTLVFAILTICLISMAKVNWLTCLLWISCLRLAVPQTWKKWRAVCAALGNFLESEEIWQPKSWQFSYTLNSGVQRVRKFIKNRQFITILITDFFFIMSIKMLLREFRRLFAGLAVTAWVVILLVCKVRVETKWEGY